MTRSILFWSYVTLLFVGVSCESECLVLNESSWFYASNETNQTVSLITYIHRNIFEELELRINDSRFLIGYDGVSAPDNVHIGETGYVPLNWTPMKIRFNNGSIDIKYYSENKNKTIRTFYTGITKPYKFKFKGTFAFCSGTSPMWEINNNPKIIEMNYELKFKSLLAIKTKTPTLVKISINKMESLLNVTDYIELLIDVSPIDYQMKEVTLWHNTEKIINTKDEKFETKIRSYGTNVTVTMFLYVINSVSNSSGDEIITKAVNDVRCDQKNKNFNVKFDKNFNDDDDSYNVDDEMFVRISDVTIFLIVSALLTNVLIVSITVCVSCLLCKVKKLNRMRDMISDNDNLGLL
ncbi:hypothetical protein CsNV_023 [Callinectes sapidus nudivirus]|nr:hypothetical protein CsNV_023 [Callinectes sapidus nudivirus]